MKYGVELVISAIILIIVLIVVGYFIRKKYHKEIDRLKARKLELMNRPVAEELAKVKQLNMTGQTEELFEKWRKIWDEIIAEKLPHIDEMLYGLEEYVDKFQLNQVKQARSEIEEKLIHIDQQIKEILEELAELLGSKEQNKEDIKELLEKQSLAEKRLLTERHSFGECAELLDKLLQSTAKKIARYEQLTNQGDYLEAREKVLSLQADLDPLTIKIEKIPQLLKECKILIPAQQKELANGYQEMKEQEYILDHIQMDQILEEIDKRLVKFIELLAKAEVDEVEAGIEKVNEKIDVLYDLLEKEVYARHDVLHKNTQTIAYLDRLKETNEAIKSETDIVQETYQLFANDLDIPITLEKRLSQLTSRMNMLRGKISQDQSAYSLLNKELSEIEIELEKLESDQKLFSERLQSLRKDELEARENITLLKRKVADITRAVHQSRMPGLPSDFESLYEKASEQIEHVFKALQEKPLNMDSVQRYLGEATDTVEHLYKRTDEHIENARFAEQVIQYANRYRGQDAGLRADLEQAEQAFRNYEYLSAFEQAAAAVEKVEPGALKRIEQLFNEEIKIER